jgi:RimJ/RimL family protein N-acetyltransferase
MKKLGLQHEGIIRKSRFKDRMWVDEIRFGILREEWEEKRSKND